jgi:DNA-binding transcriptional LysR family regulator
VRLTDAGRLLADHAIEVLRAEEAALAAARAVGTEVVGRIVTEVFSLAVAHDHTGADRIPLSDAAAWPWILTPESAPFGRAIRSACRAAGFEPDVIHEVTDTAAAILLATRGLGVTPVTPLMRQLVAGAPRIVALHEQVTRQVVLVRHRADRGRPTVAALTRAAQAIAAAPTGEERVASQ